MSKITIKDVEHMAELARLSLSDSEKEKFSKEFSDILGYVEKLNECNTNQRMTGESTNMRMKNEELSKNKGAARGWLVDPRLIGGQADTELVNKMREDEVTREEGEKTRERFVKLAPEHDEEFIKTISPLRNNQETRKQETNNTQ